MNLFAQMRDPAPVLVQDPLDHAETTATAALEQAVPSLLRSAVRALHKRKPADWWDGSARLTSRDIDVQVGLARPQYLLQGEVAGCPTESWAEVFVALPPTWLDDVHAAGYGLLDNWFVMHIEDYDSSNRPQRIIVIDSVEDVDGYDAELVPAEPDQKFVLRWANIDWDTDKPLVTVDAAVAPRPMVSWLVSPLLKPT